MYQGLAFDIEQVMPEAIATGLFDALANIQAPDGTFGPSGAPSGNYVTVSGLGAIACMDAPPSDARIQATEAKSLADQLSLNMRHVLLSGYYPQIETDWRAVITKSDGVTVVVYDVMGAESDSQTQQTRLEVRIVTQ